MAGEVPPAFAALRAIVRRRTALVRRCPGGGTEPHGPAGSLGPGRPPRGRGHGRVAALGVHIGGVVFVATVDAVFIGLALLFVGVPLALPLVALGTMLAGIAGAFLAVPVATVAAAAPAHREERAARATRGPPAGGGGVARARKAPGGERAGLMGRSAPTAAGRRGRRDRAPRRDGAGGGERPLGAGEQRTVALLGIPTLALALAVTMVTTYLPVVAREFVGNTVVIGVIIGIEGVLALWLPLVVGTWSDRLRTRLGGRLPFMVAGSPVLVAGLVAMGFVSSLVWLVAAALAFFVGYFLAYEPYRALYPDAVPDAVAGRAQGTQALWRGLGTGLALLGGGLLLSLGQAAPFLAVAAVYAVAMGAFAAVLVHRGVPDEPRRGERAVGDDVRALARLIRRSGALRAFLLANALWELSLGALKTFIVLYVTEGLGFGRTTAALMIGGVAVVVLVSALAGGKLADRFGQAAVLQAALPVYAAGLVVPLLFTDHLLVALSVPFVAVGGGVIMALPYAVLMPLMPDDEHGALTGLYSLSRGLGTWLGPLLAGVAITALAGVFTATRGYQAMWLVCSASVALSLFPLRRLRKAESRRRADRG